MTTHDATLNQMREQDQIRAALLAATPVPTACPPWCTRPARHRWDSLDPTDSSPARAHHRNVGAVDLAQWEHARADGIVVEKPVLLVDLPVGAELTPGEAIELAGDLVHAASIVHCSGS